ncbi:hypothetical protein BJF79_39640 [Actinomadura sp. CNU-125]|uniref:tyrosine-type recombinase/integrase n=1 Tax=Actinomadura sp. CNU-125 TaxID=1904961 RepID=UPI00095CA165|nr:tyrosine-type recombinase/integrase [Actinomadura sp. CNU-125]OLT30066.1 hypothetical protein BJF79_39640 [Actinomadura sp. CNU-125]
MESWQIALQSRDRSNHTIRSYRDSVAVFATWLAQRDNCTCLTHPDDRCPVISTTSLDGTAGALDAETVEAADVRVFLIHERRRTSSGNAHKHFRNIRAFYSWLIQQGHVEAPGPVDNDDAPTVHKKAKPPFSDGEVASLLKACGGTEFNDVRDYAIVRLLLDIGPRVSGLAGIRYTDDPHTNDVMLGQYQIRILLKGGDEYIAPIGKKAAEAIDRYIRRGRARHPFADEPWLWLGEQGPLTAHGVQAMIDRRAKRAGVTNAHPHRFRRTAATNAIEAGQNETDVMLNFGWKRPEMVRLYTEETAADRARRKHQRSSPADRF